MPLRSVMLQDDPKLQACLVQDQAHVTPGASGDHVATIQKALMVLDKAPIALTELRTQVYGPTTATAVLAYKRKRNIINYSYQTSADNIVGKMTIAAMDQEIFIFEQAGNSNRCVCGGPDGGAIDPQSLAAPSVFAAAPSAFSAAPSTFQTVSAPIGKPKGPARPRLNARLNIIIQETTAAEQIGGSFKLGADLFDRARALMAPYGIDFDQPNFLSCCGPRVFDGDEVLSGSMASCFSVRESAERVLPGRELALRILLCPFREPKTNAKEAFGVTDGGLCGSVTFPNFCLINVRKANPTASTLLHEMIHAAYPDKHLDHDKDPTSVFNEPGSQRGELQLPLEHAQQLAKSFFATTRL